MIIRGIFEIRLTFLRSLAVTGKFHLSAHVLFWHGIGSLRAIRKNVDLLERPFPAISLYKETGDLGIQESPPQPATQGRLKPDRHDGKGWEGSQGAQEE